MKKNVYLAQPQYSVDVGKEKNYWIPYSAGCIWSYCNQFTDIQENYHLAGLIFKRDSHDDILKSMVDPKIVGFSCYQWNKNFNLSLAKKIKQQWPSCTIVFGGPEVTIAFLNNNYVDSVILAEGEYSFLDVLRKKEQNLPIPSVYTKTRVEDLDYPSPYTSGVFDQLVQSHPDIKWAVTLETNRGCPFSCTFCDWGSLTYSKIRRLPIERIKDDLEWIANNPVVYIFCADANFGIFKQRDLEIAKLVAECGKKSKFLELFNATFNKNNNEDSFEILKVLGELNRGFSVSVQSLHESTLKAIKRDNLGINDLEKIFKLCHINSVNSYTEVILGLPYETKETFINGLCTLLELGQHNHIEIWFTNMLVNSELSTLNSKLSYGIKTVSTAKHFVLFDSNQDPYYELVDVVNATNTMSTDEMIDSFLYGWMIINFHIQGYTQIASKYARTQGISFRTFYDQLFEKIQIDPVLYEIYNYAKRNVTSFLYQGELEQGLGGHNLIFIGGYKIYQAKGSIFNILKELNIDSEIIDLQQAYIFDSLIDYPVQLKSKFNFETGLEEQANYLIEKRVLDQDLENFENSFYRLRRKGLIKNKIIKL